MRLIDANGVIEEIKRNKLLAKEPAAERRMEIIKNATTYVEPPDYDVDKVVEQLEERSREYNSGVRLHGKPEEMVTNEAIEIVKAGGVDE